MLLVIVLSGEAWGPVVHGLHHALLYGGAAAVPVLAGASAVAARRERSGSHEDRRIAALRLAVAQGDLSGRLPVVAGSPGAAAPRAPTSTRSGSTLVPLAVTASTAAASVHAAATATHLSQGALVAGFFLLSAVAQLGWALVALAGGGPRLWAAGAALNGAVVLAWGASRTVGLPFGIAPREGVGHWDVAATLWELVVVGVCAALLLTAGSPRGSRVRWSGPARSWLVGCVVVLVALALTGAPA